MSAKRQQTDENRQSMLARLRAEKARGWPRSQRGVWTEYTEGYTPLDSIPLVVDPGFEVEAGWEPLPPGEEYLPASRPPHPELFDNLEKVERRRLRGNPFVGGGDL